MAGFKTSGFSVNIPRTETPPLARIGALQGFNPATFAMDLVAPYIQGMRSGESLVAPIAEGIKAFDPEVQSQREFNQKLRDFKVENFPLEAELTKLNLANAKGDAEIAGFKRDFLKKAYGNQGGQLENFQLGPNGELMMTAKAAAEREKTIAEAKKTPQEVEKEKAELEKTNLELRQKKLQVETAENLNEKQKAAAVSEIDNQIAKNKVIADAFSKLPADNAAPGAVQSTVPSAVQNVLPNTDAAPREIQPAAANKPPPKMITQFDPFTASIKQVENPEWTSWNAANKEKLDAEFNARKKALESGMPDALTAPIDKVAKFSAGGSLEPILKEKAANAVRLIQEDIKPLIGFGTAGSIGNLREWSPLVNDSKQLKAKLETLKSLVTSSQLLEMKSKGVSFGALSGPELGLLANAIDSLDKNLQDPAALKKSVENVEAFFAKAAGGGGGGGTPINLNVGGSVTAPSGLVITRTK